MLRIERSAGAVTVISRFARMIEDLRVYPERMKENLELTGGLYEAQRVLLALVGKGVGRQEGYVYVQRNAMKVWEEKVTSGPR